MIKEIKISHHKIIWPFVLAVVIFLLPQITSAATIRFSPNGGPANTGQTFNVSILVSSTDQSVNAVDGKINFPTDTLQVVSISKSSSIIGLWVEDPTFSNSSGSISFAGTILNPGFTGSGGRVVTISFRPKKVGSARISFDSTQILANDGLGTNVLTGGLPEATFNINEGEVSADLPPGAPTIHSPTHPDQSKWYALPNAKFVWDVPVGAKAVRMILDKHSQTTPTSGYDLVDNREISNIDDGIFYFHLRVQNADGWSDSAHYKIQVDTSKPNKFELREVERSDLTDRRVQFIFDAEDEISGIDHYEIVVNGGEVENFPSSRGNTYEVSNLKSGRHTIYVRAVDRAGNYLDKRLEFVIERPVFITIGKWALSAMAIIMPLLTLLFLIFVFAAYLYFRYRSIRRSMYSEEKEAEEMVEKSLALIKEDIRSDASAKDIAQDLLDAEKAIKKEIRDITEAPVKRRRKSDKATE